jgi:flagellar hook-basal body complex protein FliE
MEVNMNVNGVDSLLAQIRQIRSQMPIVHGSMGADSSGAAGSASPAGAVKTDFAAVLKSSLDGVAAMQNNADATEKSFVLGDPNVSLSNVMIDMQKANISFQTAIQVRNKVIAAYNDIMNMQV